MRVRTCAVTTLAFGILIGAGGCSSESPLSPSASAANKGGVPAGGNRPDTVSAGARPDTSTASINGGYIIVGS